MNCVRRITRGWLSHLGHDVGSVSGELQFADLCCFPPLVFTGTYHYWNFLFVCRGLTQMQEEQKGCFPMQESQKGCITGTATASVLRCAAFVGAQAGQQNRYVMDFARCMREACVFAAVCHYGAFLGFIWAVCPCRFG